MSKHHRLLVQLSKIIHTRSISSSAIQSQTSKTSSQFLVEASQVLQNNSENCNHNDSNPKITHKLQPFILERYLAINEFQSKHQLSCSDATGWKQSDILELADEECKQLWNNLSLQYTESLGHPLLLEEIYLKYREKIEENSNTKCSSDSYFDPSQNSIRILECIPAEGILMTMMAFLSPGDEIIVQTPCYQSLSEIGRSRGCQVINWDPIYDEGSNEWKFDITLLEKTLASHHKIKMIVLNSPHNPTGYFFTQAELLKISELCFKSNTILFVDEMYADILEEKQDTITSSTVSVYESSDSKPKRLTPLISAVGLPNSIVLSGLSKPAGLPGLRTGWLAVSREQTTLRGTMSSKRLHHHLSSCSN